MFKSRLMLLSVAIVGGTLATARADYFAAIDPMAGQEVSFATGISADGRTVIGYSANPSFNQYTGIRWTSAGGSQGIGEFVPQAASADASVIGGSTPNVGFGTSGRIWTAAGGVQGGYGQAVTSVSADGTIVAGADGNGGAIWTPGGVIHTGGDAVRGLSADARVALATTQVGGVGGFTTYDTYFWTEPRGLTSIGHAPGMEKTLGRAISADGTTIVGIQSDQNYLRNGEAFAWTEAGGFTGLGKLYAGGYSSAGAITSTGFLGTMIVGNSGPGQDSSGGSEAFLWTEDLGMVSLTEFLTRNGLGSQLAGWTLTDATGISADGLTIVGNGRDASGNVRGWVANIQPVPEPSSVALLIAGLAGVGFASRKRRRAETK